MKVLLVHSYYTQRGGEDECFEDERRMLLEHGHEVSEYLRSNTELSTKRPLRLARQTLWNGAAARELGDLISTIRPDVVHFTNTFPLLSPAVLHTAHRRGVAVVQSLHNYRLTCPNAFLLRNGRPCRDCIGKALPWLAVKHACYRESRPATFVVASMLGMHRMMGTWREQVDAYFTLTHFSREIMIEAGLPKDRLHVKYNSVVPQNFPDAEPRADIVFVGRLSEEKGITLLLEAWSQSAALPRLKIIGDGPLAPEVRAAETADPRIEWLGFLDPSELFPILAAAQALIMPSLWYEVCPRTILEAHACGTPTIASRLGAMQELIDEGRTGLLFEPGDAADLGRTVLKLLALPLVERQKMSRCARERHGEFFTPEMNYRRLIEVYDEARVLADRRSPSAT